MVCLLAHSVTALGSLREAQCALDAQGIHVSLTRISTAVRVTALAARRLREDDPSLRKLELQDALIVVSIDGGRMRIRRDKKGSKTKKNRKRYTTDWREPKLLCIYFLSKDGEIDRSIHCLLDYYHMKGYLHNMAGAAKDWTEKKRKQWLGQMTKLLFSGDNVSFEKEVKSLQKHSRRKSVLRTAGNYLLKHSRAGRMNYRQVKFRNLPIGSGVIESTVRRVVNLRLKGASVYWKESMANDMLLLRCFFKALRWNHIENQAFQPLKLASGFTTN